ncbi:hypothetical protein L1765_12260 [Microaerobacter geothermalis]|uniref:hypothetical protein n=1 Tax=Microaerobacter geothermalis TaxID=674972 RepID=UPI001F21CFF3|nr:hypothetical protein [Microaerobacter geothermalis]MCF6094734.1 hypothetical protein [Microaerobacter geothermalis]
MNNHDLTCFHLDILETINELEQVFEEEDFLEIEYLEGDDGPVAREMFRILSLLRKEQADLEKAEAIVRKRRGGIKERFGIKVDEEKMTDSIQKNNDWKAFKLKNRH